MNRSTYVAAIFSIVGLLSSYGDASEVVGHPNLIMTKADVDRIRSELGSVPLFDRSVKAAQEEVDAEIAFGIDTPIPRDFSGGYTHERHKRNFFVMQKAGVLYQVLDDEKYAEFVRDMLFQYEAMYLDLPLHPQERSYARGKLFWQCLNDANWLVYASQAYDTIYEFLSAEERKRLEDNLFRPFADHISLDNPRFFNRIHNHSTWGTAAVGMIGLVMGDDELVQRALHGMPFDNIDLTAMDDDGGLFWEAGQESGFLANLESPFSPDGYYTEGPYYQRYAMYPFLIFAQALHNARPETDAFGYKNGVLIKAVSAILNLSDADGEFFPLNDAQKGMSYHSRELVSAVDIAYHVGGQNPQLLDIAEKQGQVLIDGAGLSVALAVRDGKTQPFAKMSISLSDGPNGNQGGVSVLRYGDEDLALVFKYSAQGLSHGHYDKLSYSLYEQGDEVLQDYGMARFVNIEQKGGGNYLSENTTWSKQTISHNTITLNETSHFQGKYEIGSQHHSELRFADLSDPAIQVVSATETNAYAGAEMVRTLALIKNENFEKPFLLDIFKVMSDAKNRHDLPFYFMGQVVDINFEYETPPTLVPLGNGSGYEHLYLEGFGNPEVNNTKFSWMQGGRFYTLTSATELSDELLMTRIGANDPEFNLRRDAALIIRRDVVGDTLFATIIEPHGTYSPVTEVATNSRSSVAALHITYDEEDYTAIEIEDIEGRVNIFILSNSDASKSSVHKLEIGGKSYDWSGPFNYVEL